MECIFCNSESKVQMYGNEEIITCNRCGKYVMPYNTSYLIEKIFENEIDFIGKKYLFVSYIYQQNELGNLYYKITPENLKIAFYSGEIPRQIHHKLDSFMERLYKLTTFFGEEFYFNYSDYYKYYALNDLEYTNMLSALKESDYIKNSSSATRFQITIKGIDYLESKSNQKIESSRCFVAMWFDQEMLEIFQNTISKVVKDIGFDAIIIPMVEHNDNINDHIIAEIKKSKFLIADFTGNRGGVYFEAGFALGLGKQVIWTCREDYFNTMKERTVRSFDSEKKEITISFYENYSIHFDINHYNFIVWKDCNDLAKKLKDRIDATIKK